MPNPPYNVRQNPLKGEERPKTLDASTWIYTDSYSFGFLNDYIYPDEEVTLSFRTNKAPFDKVHIEIAVVEVKNYNLAYNSNGHTKYLSDITRKDDVCVLGETTFSCTPIEREWVYGAKTADTQITFKRPFNVYTSNFLINGIESMNSYYMFSLMIYVNGNDSKVKVSDMALHRGKIVDYNLNVPRLKTIWNEQYLNSFIEVHTEPGKKEVDFNPMIRIRNENQLPNGIWHYDSKYGCNIYGLPKGIREYKYDFTIINTGFVVFLFINTSSTDDTSLMYHWCIYKKDKINSTVYHWIDLTDGLKIVPTDERP